MSVRLGRWDSTSTPSEIAKADILAGAPSGFARHYLAINGNWDGGFTQWAYDHARINVYSIHSWTGSKDRTAVPWVDITAGRFDAAILASARGLKDIPNRTVPAYIVFHHEPENEEDGKVSGDLPAGQTCGTRQEFAKAADHFRFVIRQVLAPSDALFGVTFMAGTYRSGRWREWVPDKYQFLGIDGYSHGNPKETASYIHAPAHQAAVEAARSLFIQETGCEEIEGTRFKAGFFDELRQLGREWPELIGIEYSNVQAKGDYQIDTTPESLSAFRAWSADPYYTGSWT